MSCAYNALSAVTQLPYARLVQSDGVEGVMRDVVKECLAVAQGLGVRVAGDTWEAVQRIARTMPKQYSSTAQDLARGKRSEIDHLNGVLFVDYLSKLKRDRVLKKFTKAAKRATE